MCISTVHKLGHSEIQKTLAQSCSHWARSSQNSRKWKEWRVCSKKAKQMRSHHLTRKESKQCKGRKEAKQSKGKESRTPKRTAKKKQANILVVGVKMNNEP